VERGVGGLCALGLIAAMVACAWAALPASATTGMSLQCDAHVGGGAVGRVLRVYTVTAFAHYGCNDTRTGMEVTLVAQRWIRRRWVVIGSTTRPPAFRRPRGATAWVDGINLHQRVPFCNGGRYRAVFTITAPPQNGQPAYIFQSIGRTHVQPNVCH
jgi:hypothetical protein